MRATLGGDRIVVSWTLSQRGALGLGAEGARAADRDWHDLALLLRAQLEAGAAPSCERVQQLARRAHDYIAVTSPRARDSRPADTRGQDACRASI